MFFGSEHTVFLRIIHKNVYSIKIYVVEVRHIADITYNSGLTEKEVHRLKNQTDYNSRNHSWIRMFAAAVGIVCILNGCGQEEAVQTGADVQAEAGTQTEDEAMSGEGTDETPENAELDVADGNEPASTENIVIEPSETDKVGAQMEIDEETRKELTAQLLEENNLDTSVIEPKRSTKGCTFDLPEGFEESEDMAGMYVTGRYPLDASTIYYVAMNQDIALQLLTQESFKEQTQESLRQAYGEDIEVTVDSFESIEVSGYPAFRILCHYQVNRIEITQLEYAINADKSYMITYSQTGDYDRMEEYEASAATIRVQ